MDYDIILISPLSAIGITLTQSAQGISASSTTLSSGYSIYNDGSRLIFVTPVGAYLPSDPITPDRAVLSVQKLGDTAIYIVKFVGSAVSPAAGTLDFSDPANSGLIPAL